MERQHTTAILGLVLIFVTSVVVDGQNCGDKKCTNALPYCCLKSYYPYCAVSTRSCVAKKYCGSFSCSLTKPHCCGEGSAAHCARSPSECIASKCGNESCSRLKPFCCKIGDLSYCAFSERSCVYRRPCGKYVCFRSNPYCCKAVGGGFCTSNAEICERAIRTTPAITTEIAKTTGLNPRFLSRNGTTIKAPWLWTKAFTSEDSTIDKREESNATPNVVKSTSITMESPVVSQSPELPLSRTSLPTNFSQNPVTVSKSVVTTEDSSSVAHATTKFQQTSTKDLSRNGTTIKAPWLWTKAFTSEDSTIDKREESNATPNVVKSTSITMESPVVSQSPEPPLSRTSLPTNFSQNPVTVSKSVVTIEDSSSVAHATTKFQQTSTKDVSEIYRSSTASVLVQATQSDAPGFLGIKHTTSAAVDTNSTLTNQLSTKDDAGAVPAAATAAAGVGAVVLVVAVPVAFALLKLILLFVSFYIRRYRSKNEVYDINSSQTTSCWGSSERGDVKMISKSSSPRNDSTALNVYENEFFEETTT